MNLQLEVVKIQLEILNLRQKAMKNFANLDDKGKQVLLNIDDMMGVADTMLGYSQVLMDRKTLETEGFIIPKYERAIMTLMNCKTRIKQNQK